MKHLPVKSILFFFLFLLYAFDGWGQDTDLQEPIVSDTLQLYIRNAQYGQAIEFINRQEPTKELLYQKVLCFRYLNDYSTAIAILDSLSAEYPEDVPVILQLALCYEAASLYSKSMDCYDHLLRIDSTNTYFEVRKADLLFRSEKYAPALAIYSRIDSTYSPNYIARCQAICYDKLNQSDSAKMYYSKAWGLDSLDAYSANSLVKLCLKNEDYLSAYTYSEQFIANDSTNATMNALNAYTYYNMKYYDIAIERFEKCLQQGDSSSLVNSSLGFSYYLIDKDSLARPFLQQAFLQDTTNNNVLYNLGKVNFDLGYYPDAAECFQKMVDKLVPSDVLLFNLYKSLAMAQEKSGMFDMAMDTYRKALGWTEDNKDKMELFFSMATISEHEFKNNPMAIDYYKEYRRCLFNYENSLDEEEQDSINGIESKLKALDEYIQSLRVERGKVE